MRLYSTNGFTDNVRTRLDGEYAVRGLVADDLRRIRYLNTGHPVRSVCLRPGESWMFVWPDKSWRLAWTGE